MTEVGITYYPIREKFYQPCISSDKLLEKISEQNIGEDNIVAMINNNDNLLIDKIKGNVGNKTWSVMYRADIDERFTNLERDVCELKKLKPIILEMCKMEEIESSESSSSDEEVVVNDLIEPQIQNTATHIFRRTTSHKCFKIKSIYG